MRKRLLLLPHCQTRFLGISTIFQFHPTPMSNKNQSFTHSAELELYIDEALKKAFFSGIFKS